MWDLGTIVAMNAAPVKNQYIYDLGNGKFALGNIGKKATYVVRRIPAGGVLAGDKRGRPSYLGVQARRPRIPADAKRIPRSAASRALRKALGL